jgi:phage shock protein A
LQSRGLNHVNAARKSGFVEQKVSDAVVELQKARQNAVEFEEEAKEIKEKYDMAMKMNGNAQPLLLINKSEQFKTEMQVTMVENASLKEKVSHLEKSVTDAKTQLSEYDKNK